MMYHVDMRLFLYPYMNSVKFFSFHAFYRGKLLDWAQFQIKKILAYLNFNTTGKFIIFSALFFSSPIFFVVSPLSNRGLILVEWGRTYCIWSPMYVGWKRYLIYQFSRISAHMHRFNAFCNNTTLSLAIAPETTSHGRSFSVNH